MAIRNGFNSPARGLLVSGGDRNLIIRLVAATKGGQRIRGIHYSYGIDSGSSSVVFVEGRVMILKGIVEDETLEFYPDTATRQPGTAKTNFDAYFDQTVTDQMGFISFGESGLYIPENTDATVILTAPTTSAAVQPAFGSMIGSLMIFGVSEGLPNPFKNLR